MRSIGDIISRRLFTLIIALILGSSPLAARTVSAARLLSSASPAAAFQAALDSYNARHAIRYAITLSGQSGSLAYASCTPTELASNGEDFLVLLAAEDEQGWSVLIPSESPAADYDRLLDAFPDDVIDPATRALLRQEGPAGQNNSSLSTANYSAHKLPWRFGNYAYVTQIDTSSHMNQVDFDIQGLSASGDVYASKPGKVVFVKQSSSATCSVPAPDPCWKKANMVVIEHPSGEYSWYVHLAYNSVTVSVGQNIDYGTKVGVEGQTGYSFGVHLHYMASSGHTTWTDPNNPNDAPWATGITAVDFDEYPWSKLIESYTYIYTSQNAGNLPSPCPGAGGVLLYRDSSYSCAAQAENSGFILRTGPGFQNLPDPLNNAASSVRVPAGQSVLLYENSDRGGGKKCLNAPGEDNFAGDTFSNGAALDNQVSSFEVFPAPGCPAPAAVDLTAPLGSFTSPNAGAAVGRTVQLTASASDNSGNLQVVRFTAKWGGQARVVYADTTAPYQYTWDLCASGVPDGDVELGLVVVDAAWNSFTASGIHITKSYACAPPTGTAWSADYWANPNLTGDPALHLAEPGPFLFHNWGDSSPGENLPADGWSARFTRTVDFPGGDYRFHCQSSDGCRLLIDGQARISAWQDADFAGSDWTGALAGSHMIAVEYYDNTGDARLEAWWQGPGFLPRDAVCDDGQWCLDAWGNAGLAGTAALHRNEGEMLAHDWGSLGPDPFLSAPFSARAARSAYFDCGVYRFHAVTGGGLRFWLDDAPHIDQWSEPDQVTEYTADVSLGPAPGSHTLKIEQFENSASAAFSLWWEKLSGCPVTTTVEYASTHFTRPGAEIQPSVRIRVTGGYLDPARGDALTLLPGQPIAGSTTLPVRQFVNTGDTYTFDSSTGFSATAPTANGTFTGQWQVKAGGSLVGQAASVQVTVDSQVPQVSITAPTGYLTASPITVRASATDAPSGIGHVQFFAGYQSIPGGAWAWHSLGYDLDGSDGWSQAWNTAGLPDQSKVQFFGQAWDKAGNSNGSWTSAMTLDRTPPAAALTDPAPTQDSTRFLIQWSVSDALSGVDYWDIQYQMDGSSTWQNWLMNQKSSARSAWFTGQLGHDYAFRIRAADLAGNLGAYAASTPTHVNTCTVDEFEPDNDKDHASILQVNGPAVVHKICGAGDQDWYTFQAIAGNPYLLFAAQPGPTTATVLTLYAADGITQLAQTNSTGLPLSALVWTPADDGTLYFRIRNADPLVAGDAVAYSAGVANVSTYYLSQIYKK